MDTQINVKSQFKGYWSENENCMENRVAQNAKVLNFFAPYPFSGAKLQVFLKNGHKNDVD